jgi:Got1/Sft2-like family
MYHFRHRFSVLIGPINHLKHLISKERLPFSIAYLSSLGLTLYFALGVRQSPKPICSYDHTNNPTQPHSYFGSLVGAIVQVIALVSYVLAYFPGGSQTLWFGGQMALRGVGTLLPF